MVVGLRLRPAQAEMLGVQARRAPQIRDVEERELRAGRPPLLGRILADAEQQLLADRVQLGRVARDLQLAEHAPALRQGQINSQREAARAMGS